MSPIVRTTLLFSQLWLASMLAMPISIGYAGLIDPGLKFAHCVPCAATTATVPRTAARPVTAQRV